MGSRFFVDRPITGQTAQLTGAEAQHLVKVMRAEIGDDVTLFDGGGAEYSARITQTRRNSVEFELLARHEVDRELTFDLTLGVALPKGDRQRWLIEKAVELGVTRIVPLTTFRGVAQPVDRALGRLRRTVIEASKQCGRNRLMEIATSQSLAEFVATAPGGTLRLLAHPDPPATPVGSLWQQKAPRSVFLAVGPEGGFTEDELGAARNDWQVVHLGSRTLRIETAAVALVAYVSLMWSESFYE
jgi:16S rRNA (uracil1498-N3)-methyltransferase